MNKKEMNTMSKFVATDDESNGNGIIHTTMLSAVRYGLVKVSTGPAKTRSGIKTFSYAKLFTIYDSVVIKITDTITFQDDTSLNRKHADDVNTCIANNTPMLFMTFAEMIKFRINYIENNGGICVAHCIQRDFGFLVKTQDYVGGKRVVKKTLETSPKTGMYDSRWEKFTFICSQMFICTKCPKFMAVYKAPPSESGKFMKTTLECFSQFIKNDPTYKQSHGAAQDVIDLCNVIKYINENFDTIKFVEGENCLNNGITLPLSLIKPPATQPQRDSIIRLMNQKTMSGDLESRINETKILTKENASKFIDELKACKSVYQ